MIGSGYTLNSRQSPNLIAWEKRGKSIYETTDGCYKCEKLGSTWVASYRPTVDDQYVSSKWSFGTLSACQDDCARHQRSNKGWE